MNKSPESRCCKRVRDGGVDGVVVAMIVTAGQQLQLEYLQHPDDERIKMMIMMIKMIKMMMMIPGPQDDGEPLVVGDVLDHCSDVAPGLQEHSGKKRI